MLDVMGRSSSGPRKQWRLWVWPIDSCLNQYQQSQDRHEIFAAESRCQIVFGGGLNHLNRSEFKIAVRHLQPSDHLGLLTFSKTLSGNGGTAFPVLERITVRQSGQRLSVLASCSARDCG